MSKATGVGLARGYFADVVEPLLAARRPGLRYAAARLGSGSDVLGLDDEMSRDHDWGLRLTLLVDDDAVRLDVDDLLERELPTDFRGLPTRFGTTWDATVRHRVEVATPIGFAVSRTGLDPSSPLSAVDWLSLTGQSVLEMTAGEVFRDDAGSLTAIRQRLEWYPDDLWRLVIAADWEKVGQELPFIGRTGVRADELGGQILAARIAHTLLHLGFLLERQWPPYSKWIGSMFSALPRASAAAPGIARALAAADWQQRESGLLEAIGVLAAIQGELGLPTLDPATEPFFDRRFASLRGIPEFVQASIVDERIRAMPLHGSVEQWSTSVPLLMSAASRISATRALYSSLGAGPASGAPNAAGS